MSANRGGTSWRLAARLARREVRRRPGRTALVMLLVAIPIFAMTAGSVLFRTGSDSHAEKFHRVNGRADLVSMTNLPGRIAASGVTDLLPAGSRSLVVNDANLPLTTAGAHARQSYVRLTDLQISDPTARGIVEVLDGRAPGPGEVLLSPTAADDLGAGLGSTLRLSRPDVTWRVVGIGRLADEFRAKLVVAPDFDFSVVRPGYSNERLMADVPRGTDTPALAAKLHSPGMTFEAADFEISPPNRETVRPLAWGWVAGVILLAIMGIIITAAFATGARRQLVTLGQLSANGADQRLLRRSLSLQGSWSGLLGSLLGAGAALGALIVFRSTVETVIRHDPGPYVFSLADIAIIVLTGIGAATIAAFIPARAITRVPVLSALGGRRPLGAVPRRLVPIGFLLFGSGVALLALVAAGTRNGASGAGDLFAVAAVLGGLAVLGGVCCISPVFVGGFGQISSRIGGAGRLAARSLARVRTRSAAVVTAIATAGAVAIAIATFAGMDNHRQETPSLPDNVVVISRFNDAGEAPAVMPESDGPIRVKAVAPPSSQPVTAATRAKVEAIVPGIRFSPLRRAHYLPPPRAAGDTERSAEPGLVAVADPALLDVIGLSDHDAAALAKTGALELFPIAAPRVSEDTVRFETASGPFDAAIRQDTPASDGGDVAVLVTPARAKELGFTFTTSELIGTAPTSLTSAQRDRLQTIGDAAYVTDAFYNTDTGAAVHEGVMFAQGRQVSLTTVQLWIVGGTLVFTLLVVAIGLALSAAESREERDVLVAVGARPRTLRRVAGLKALFLAVAGAFLAIPAGFVPVTLVVRTATPDLSPVKPVVFPWLTATLLLLAVPLIAGAASWLGSRIAQRANPLQMSAIAVD